MSVGRWVDAKEGRVWDWVVGGTFRAGGPCWRCRWEKVARLGTAAAAVAPTEPEMGSKVQVRHSFNMDRTLGALNICASPSKNPRHIVGSRVTNF